MNYVIGPAGPKFSPAVSKELTNGKRERGESPVRILWVANFQFPIYEAYVQNPWGHKIF